MHETSHNWMSESATKYLDQSAPLKIVDIGSCKPRKQTMTYKDIFTSRPNWEYVGADVCNGPNVDVLIDADYKWDIFPDNSFDVVVSGQVLEHVDAPWKFSLAVARICRKGGICMITAPSLWKEHRCPLDCWRLMADGMRSLFVKYAPFEELECRTVEYGSRLRRHGDTYFVGRKL